MVESSLIHNVVNCSKIHGIICQSSWPHTLHNGVVERRHKHILETAKAIRFQRHLPIRFWGECILSAVHIINRIPSTILHNKSPSKLMYMQPPDLFYMRVIGCLCHATNLIKSDKFGPSVTRSVLMGYGETQKGYWLYDLKHHMLFISRDVVFDETVFPFQNCLDMENTDPLWDASQCLDTFILHTNVFPVYDETTQVFSPPIEADKLPPIVQDHSSSSNQEMPTTPVIDIQRSMSC